MNLIFIASFIGALLLPIVGAIKVSTKSPRVGRCIVLRQINGSVNAYIMTLIIFGGLLGALGGALIVGGIEHYTQLP